MDELLNSLKGRLIVSCQAYPGEPMLDPRTMAQVALRFCIAHPACHTVIPGAKTPRQAGENSTAAND